MCSVLDGKIVLFPFSFVTFEEIIKTGKLIWIGVSAKKCILSLIGTHNFALEEAYMDSRVHSLIWLISAFFSAKIWRWILSCRLFCIS